MNLNDAKIYAVKINIYRSPRAQLWVLTYAVTHIITSGFSSSICVTLARFWEHLKKLVNWHRSLYHRLLSCFKPSSWKHFSPPISFPDARFPGWLRQSPSFYLFPTQGAQACLLPFLPWQTSFLPWHWSFSHPCLCMHSVLGTKTFEKTGLPQSCCLPSPTLTASDSCLHLWKWSKSKLFMLF